MSPPNSDRQYSGHGQTTGTITGKRVRGDPYYH